MRTALGFIKDHAKDINIDARRIALGGFSAGAMTAINLAYGEDVDVQAVIALSGTNWGYDLNTSLSSGAPPLLMFAGQWDLPDIKHGSAAISKLFASKDVAVSEAWVPNSEHFIPWKRQACPQSSTINSLIDSIAEFLDKNL